jgi:tetratricopeptide (TPR) repeat protein
VLLALAQLETDAPSRAQELLTRALEIRRALLASGDPRLAECLAALGALYAQHGEIDKALASYRQALAVFPHAQARRNPVALTALDDLAVLHVRRNELSEAEALQREAIEVARQVLGAENITLANLLNNLGTTQAAGGKHVEAEATFRDAFAMHLALLGEGHVRTRNVARNVGRALALQRRHREALVWLERALAASVKEDADNPTGRWGIRTQRAQVLFHLGRREEAVAEVSAAKAALERSSDAEAGSALANARVLWGRLQTEIGKPEEAVPELEAAQASLRAQWGDQHPRFAEAACALSRARLLRQRSPEELAALKRCLSVYRAWGLAEPEAVAALEGSLHSEVR